MFNFNELKSVHVEISNRCQASCPMCPRNIHGGIENPLLTINEWTLHDFIKIFPIDILEQLDTINFCGNFGDPLMNADLIDMCKYIKDNAPDVRIEIHTNGSLRSTTWWKNLYDVLPNRHIVVFALDGLADTHSLYRVGTNYDLILKNAKTFIDAGGLAEWMFIRFKHNEHQVDAAEEVAKQTGFKKFTVKNSRRHARPFPVVNNQGTFLYNLEQPSDSTVKFVSKQDIAGHQSWPNADKINCVAIKDKELFIDAHYQLSPCCMIGAFLHTNYDVNLLKSYNLYQEDSVIEEGEKVRQQVLGFPRLNVLETGLKNIVETDQWQTMWQQKWRDKSSSTCIIMCGPHSPFISIDDQKIKVEQNG
jgi:sulfatase maturation enzyme AslB (radical SAM superfamily)